MAYGLYTNNSASLCGPLVKPVMIYMHTITSSIFIRLVSPKFRWVTKIRPFWVMAFLFLIGLYGSAAQSQSLQIDKSVDKTSADPNTALFYTIQYNCVSITNPCTNVVIKDKLPNPIYSAALSTNTGTATFDPSTKLATFTLGTLPAGTTGQVTVSAIISAATPGGTVLPNSATITSGSSTTVSNTVSTTVNALTKLDLNKFASSTPPLGDSKLPQSGTGQYSFYLGVSGNVPLTNFCATDTLPLADKLNVTTIYTGLYTNYSSTVQIDYQTNTNNTWTALTGAPFSTTINTSVPVNLPNGQYMTAIRFCMNSPFSPGAYTSGKPTVQFNVAADTPLGAYTNCVSVTSTQLNQKKCISPQIVPASTGASVGLLKDANNSTPALGDTLVYLLTSTNNDSPSQALQNGIIADAFDPGALDYVPNSWSYTSTYSATTPVFSSTTINGQTVLKWALTGDMPPSQSITIMLKAVVKNTAISHSTTNTQYLIGTNLTGCPNGSVSDIYDIDGDGNTAEQVCSYNKSISIQSLAKLTSEKLIKGQLDATYSKYPAFGNTVPGGSADYRLKVYNAGSVPITNAVVIDILPFIGDNGVLDPQTRLSQWRPNLAGPVTPSTGVTVYYSTQSNPCRPELNYNPAGCTNANWSTVPPADLTQVQALKFDFGSTIINPGDSLFLSWPMRAPTTAPMNGEIAWNSFGYVGTRTDNNTQLLPAEPIKVGIKVNPLVPADYGDFVWLDTNKDGIQDAGELGVPGVKVELYKDNGDGVPDKTTDALVGFTVTDASGNYLFSNLQPGDYFAIFYPPSGYAVSPSLAGSDRSKDSEGVITTVTSLSANEVDLTWDLGIYPSTTCDVKITNATVSPCNYTGTSSIATVNVFVTWANAPAGQNITVSVAGAPSQTINVTGGATSPTLLTFTIAADGASHAVTAGFSASCQDQASILSPQPCAPAVCSLGLTNVLVGACIGTNRQINATVSWSNNPSGENIIVTWDGVPVDTILIAGGLGSPQPTSFYVTGDAATHTIAAHFASTSACQASVSGITVPACVLPCGLVMVVTPSLCQSATNAYSVTAVVSLTNSTTGVLTVSTGTQSLTFATTATPSAVVTATFTGLPSDGASHTMTASLPGCSSTDTAYTAPASCVCPPGKCIPVIIQKIR